MTSLWQQKLENLKTIWEEFNSASENVILMRKGNWNISKFTQRRIVNLSVLRLLVSWIINLLKKFTFSVNDKCDCVPYNFIRNSTMFVCDYYRMTYCVNKIAKLPNLTAFDNLFTSHNVCNCLPLCNYVKYSYTIHRSRFKKGIVEENIWVTIKWKDSEYYAIIRSQQLRLVDFFSYLSGIWGLFAGISVLSIVEIFYFLTLRLTNDLIRFFRQ